MSRREIRLAQGGNLVGPRPGSVKLPLRAFSLFAYPCEKGVALLVPDPFLAGRFFAGRWGLWELRR